MKPETAIREEFEREGFYVRRGLFTDEVVLLDALLDGSRERIREIEDVTLDAGGRGATNLGYLGHADDVIGRFVSTQNLVGLAAGILGEEVYLLKARLNVKWPADAPDLRGAWEPHQDRAAWTKEGLPGKAALTVALAIDRCDEHNGAIEVFPRSHVYGIIEHSRVGEGYGIPNETCRRFAAAQGVRRIDLDPGDALLFSGDLIHQSPPNNSIRRRGILFITYNAVSNSPAEGVGPSRYRCRGPLKKTSDDELLELLHRFNTGAYSPSLDYEAIARIRQADIAEDYDSGWTEFTPTLG